MPDQRPETARRANPVATVLTVSNLFWIENYVAHKLRDKHHSTPLDRHERRTIEQAKEERHNDKEAAY